ncbi:ArsR family transcriptional regulator [Methanoplanus sp. FWC-SCC4]|uniref:ArsR family transcriptional regulator n=1 Tax=Methanochimaera problematica TaxID=2609417 RepID=A0AA97FFU8_9EURY|nr:flavodoxin [Methanoplanus sp. FWC-SCC4]WOF16686.1 ArsR family transcriptional regulator [Methanoplanus sp. FWC-SCC4]
MSVCIIYHSESGNTKEIAQKLSKITGADLIEVKPSKKYSKISLYTLGIKRAISGDLDPINHDKLDVSDYDTIVIGTPVWAGRQTPAINSAINALTGHKDKDAIVYATYKKDKAETFDILTTKLTENGMNVKSSFGFSESEINDNEKISGLAQLI